MSYQIIWTEEKKAKAIEMLTKYFEEYGSGESIMQSDFALIASPELLSNIADEVLVEGQGILFSWQEP
jgi:hypothetical protein